MSYHCLENVFNGIKFTDPIRGINGARTPAERLHLLNHGLFQLILAYNFGQKRAKKVKKNITQMLRVVDKENSDEDVDETEHTEQSDEEEYPKNDESKGINGLHDDRTNSNIGLFTPTISDKFDRDAKEYGRNLQKQSCRYWKRSFFYQEFLPIPRRLVTRKETVCCCTF
jgi:hypothetical protein